VEGLKHLQTNGVCKYLVNDQCSIYKNRPDLCQYDALYEMLKDQISPEDYDKLSVIYCEQLQNLKKENSTQ
jgi:Fe-S-cluster containining protein